MPAVDLLMRRAVADSIFPGGVILVSEGGRTRFFRAYGCSNALTRRQMTVDTRFDLASLTKPLATAAGAMVLVQQDRLDLGQALGELLPPFQNTPKAEVSIAQLLSHTSGLPDYKPYFRRLAWVAPSERKRVLRELLVQEPLLFPPGHGVLYSDLDFMILEWVIETVAGMRLDRFLTDSTYAPLKAGPLFFIEVGFPLPAGDYAATEQCPWRGRLIEGEVHDENAFVLGGVSGHAGLFGTAAGVHDLLVELLEAYHGRPGRQLFDPKVVRLFFRQVAGTGKALGFDMPSVPLSSSGRHFSAGSVGHLGFTGTSFWINLERSICVVLLTNRIHPSRENIAIRAFRPLIHDAVMEALRIA